MKNAKQAAKEAYISEDEANKAKEASETAC